MDWDTKIPYWDLPELERGCEPNIGLVASNPSSAVHDRQKSVMGCSVDLKLGGLGDFGSSSRWKEPQKATTPAASPPGPSKRARTPNNGCQIASCLVDGCKSDLSNCKDYHRRHKVCENHSKTPIVFVGGQEQRFCQQCSRFHLLVEFDDVKRSCRKRLDGHNRRRRKPQIDPINSGIFHPNLQGSRFSSYSHMFPAMVPDPPNWSSVVKDEANDHHKLSSPLHFINRQQSFPGSYTRSYIEGKRFPFLQDNDIFNAISFSGSSSNNSGKMFSAGLTPVLDSDCALSLLSSSTRASTINTNHMVPADQIPVAQPMPHIQQQYGFGRFSRSQSLNNVSPTGFSCSGVTDRHVSTVLVSDSNADLQCSSIFQVDGEGSNNGPCTVLPFPWSS